MEAAFSRATRQNSTGALRIGGVDNAALEQVLVFLGAGVVAVAAFAVLNLVYNHAGKCLERY